MTALLLQTLMLMVPAFFVGAALACWIRRLTAPEARARAAVPASRAAAPVEPLTQYAGRPPAPPAPVVAAAPRAALDAAPAPAAAATAPAAVSRFDATLKARAEEPPRPAPAAPQAAPIVAPVAAPAVVTVIETKAPEVVRPVAPPPPPPAPPAAAARPAVVEPAVPMAPVVAPVVAPVTPPATSAMIASAAAAAAAAVAAVTAQARTAVAPLVAPVETPVATTVATPLAAEATVVAPPVAVTPRAAGTADDLTRISTIDDALSGQLHKLGITQFSQIAGWRKSDVGSMSTALGYQGRIEQENWIEQAQILANGGETYYSARRGRTSSAVPMAPVAAAPMAAAPTAATLTPAVMQPAVTQPASAPQVAERSAFATAPAALREAPALAVSAPLPVAAAAAVEQAVKAAVTPAPTPVTLGAADQATATPVRPVVVPTRDNLQRIGGVNAEIEKLLGAQSITRFNQIAGWGTGDIERFDRLLGSQGRITRENWVEQAQILAKGGDTAHSREFDRRATEMPRDTALRPKSIADAIAANAGAAPPSRPDIAGLRSVRSDAYRTPATDAATAAAAAAAAGTGSAKVVRSAEIDDLKRIRGIGVLIEKRLNSVGVVSYGQIAEWTNEDIDRVSATLDFKGRIERENWVEQARILASGGQTEFSRRVDRGEVETSKPKS